MADQSSDDPFLAALREEHSRWRTAWELRHTEDIPSVVYHYTTSTGLLGIVEQQALWASNAAFLNDATELVYTGEVLAEVIKELRESYGIDFTAARHSSESEGYAVAAAEMLGSLFPSMSSSMFDVYVACFCSNDDLLSQWRGYPSGGGVYALGVRTRSLGRGGRLRRVVYDRETQLNIVRELLTPICEHMAAKQNDEDAHRYYDRLIRRHLGQVAVSLSDCSFCFKHPKFSEESEWRVVLVRSRASGEATGSHGSASSRNTWRPVAVCAAFTRCRRRG